MKIKTVFATLLTSAVLVTCSGSVYASEVDALIEKLVEKRVLTESEAKDIVKEIKAENEKIKEPSSSWADKVKLKGDVRFRYQTEDKDSSDVSRDRYRVRARAGIYANPDENWEAAIGFATGGSDPRSTNSTLDSQFSSLGVVVDYAYAKYSPNKTFSIMGGKIKNPIWGTKDLLWDGDINPEGIAAEINYNINDNVKLFVTPGYFMLDEYKSSEDDPAMIFLQPGIDWKINDTVGLKFAAAYYDFTNIAGNDFSEFSGGGNSTDEYDLWLYDYKATTLDVDLGFKLKADFLDYVNVFGQYVNSDADNDNTGYLYGFKIGDKSLNTLKSWEFKVNYRHLEKDAWLDFLPDSDFYGGATGVEGMEAELKLGLTKHVSFALDYYSADPIDGDNTQDIIQADFVVKF